MNENLLLKRKEKIAEVLIKRNRLKNVLLKDLYLFAKKHIDPKLSTSIRKSELLPIVSEYISADTLLTCAEELPRFGLALCDLPEALDISKDEAIKLVDEEKITLLNIVKYTYYPCTIYVFSIKDAIEVEEKGLLNHNF